MPRVLAITLTRLDEARPDVINIVIPFHVQCSLPSVNSEGMFNVLCEGGAEHTRSFPKIPRVQMEDVGLFNGRDLNAVLQAHSPAWHKNHS